jgi:hypothetical protein
VIRARWRGTSVGDGHRPPATTPRRSTIGDGAADRAPSPCGGEDLDLHALAAAVCRRYYAEFADEDAVYGDVGRAWCQHDNQHLLNWAALAAAGAVSLDDQVAWLARVLESRAFPILRLARSLELGGAVVRERLGAGAEAMARKLDGAAAMIRERGTFLEG